MTRKNFGLDAISILLGACSIGLLALISCGAPSSSGGDSDGTDADTDTDTDTNAVVGTERELLACCLADESCVVMPFIDCALGTGTGTPIGTPLDGVSTCADDPCHKGACCNNGDCQETTEAECDHRYQGDATSCGFGWCALGACCVAEEFGGCMDVNDVACASQFEGTWQGFDTPCEPTKPCGGEPDQGACCSNDGGCTITDHTTCVLSDRSYVGDGIDCANGLCDMGACCGQDDSCSETVRLGCFDNFQGLGTRCATTSCSIVGGACCLPDGSCTETNDQTQCEEALAASFQGPGSSCFGTICTATTGACCLGNECVVADNEAACDAMTGLSGISTTFRGAGAPCVFPDGNETCGGPLRGACCWSFGRCEGATVERCALLEEGVFIGINVSCSDFARLPDTCTTR